jgi:hypothetical protein
MDFLTKIWIWIKGNILISLLVLFAVIIVFFPKLLRGLTGKRRIRHQKNYYPAAISRRSARNRRLRRLPRSVGMLPRKQYTKGGKAKKPWQIKGSEAARRHMAKIRRMR